MVGVGGVIVADDRVLLARRGSEPMRGEWSIPGGVLEVGESLAEGVMRELREETGLAVRVLDLIEALDRILPDPAGQRSIRRKRGTGGRAPEAALSLRDSGLPVRNRRRGAARRWRHHGAGFRS